jgi:hypothetical protein
MKGLNHVLELTELRYLCLSKVAILKLWKYLRSTASRDLLTCPSSKEGGICKHLMATSPQNLLEIHPRPVNL